MAGRWAALQSTPLGKTFPQTIALEGKLGLPKQIDLPSPLTLIFGLNGVGKSRILQEISKSCDGCVVVSLSELIYYLQHEVGKRTDIVDLIEENSPLSTDKVRAIEVADLVRRDYEDVKWYAVPIVDSPFAAIVGEDVVPIFTVKHAGQEYDFRTMGLGELSAHLLLWILAYTRGDDAVPLLLDEPEAFMPPPSRDGVLSYLVEETFGRKSPVVVTSHSLELISPALDSNSAVFLSESGNAVTALGPSDTLADRVAGLFGRSVSADWLILCEDESAYVLADELLRAVAPRLWQGCRFLWCKGYGDLEKIWEHLPRPNIMPDGVMSFAFLADGDQAETVTAAKIKRASNTREGELFWPLFCLPGDPDALMKSAAASDITGLARQFRLSEDSLRGILERLRGREPHNWTESILAEITLDRQSALRALAISFVASPSNVHTLNQFRDELSAAAMVPQSKRGEGSPE